MPPNEVKAGGCSPLALHHPPPYSPLRAAQMAGARRPFSWEPTSCEAEPKLREGNGGHQQEQRCWSEQRASQVDPVKQMDAELKRLREAPVQMVKNAGKFQLTVDMSIFRPDDIQLLLSPGRLVICAEREVRLDDRTSIVRRFRRKLAIPEDVDTAAIATQFSRQGHLTITVLRHRARA